MGDSLREGRPGILAERHGRVERRNTTWEMTYEKRGRIAEIAEDADYFAGKKRDASPGHLKIPRRSVHFQTT
jgi:hypothetical protein